MNNRHTAWTLTGFFLLGAGLAPAWAEPEDEPALRGPISMQDSSRAFVPRVEGPPHEAVRPPGRSEAPLWVGKAPPPPIVERPTGEPPSRDAQWVEGYWDWEQGRGDFDWVPGSWSVPPAGKVWSPGEWRRDTQGWYRVAGSWVDRPPIRVDWRMQGPPADQPAEPIGPAPGPDYFYIPGRYAPEGDGLVWKPGFWAKVQPGWDWVPALWVRQADGWSYREGFWAKDRGAQPASAVAENPARVDEMTRRTSARPVSGTANFPEDGASGLDRDPRLDPAASMGANGPRDLSPGAWGANGEDLPSLSGGGDLSGNPDAGQRIGSPASAGAGAAYGTAAPPGINGVPPALRQPLPPGYVYYRYPPRPVLVTPRTWVRGFLRRSLR